MSNAPNEHPSPDEHAESECRQDRSLAASVERLRREFDHWLDVALSQGEKALDAVGLKGGLGWSPAVDVVEWVDDVTVFVDLPGVDPQAIELTLAGNMLTLKGEKPAVAADDAHVVLRTRPRGKFTRSVPLPVPVDPDQVAADAKDGVLTVRLTKSERARARQIPVGGGQVDSGEA